MKTLFEQITCVKEEIARRNRVYSKLVLNERMKPNIADHAIQCMEAVLKTLQGLENPDLFKETNDL